MRDACEDTNRKLICVDLGDADRGVWAPFAGGNRRDRRARLMHAFGLDDSGQESDFYKVKERQIIDGLFERWDGCIRSLSALLQQSDYVDDTKRIRSYLNEWLYVRSLSPEQGRGLSISRCIEEGTVLYVKASITDLVVIKAATILIMEVVQETMRLYKEGKRENHLFFVIDEVRFMISEMLANALATVTGFDTNLLIAYQSILDIRNLRDHRVNVRSIEQSVNVNCKISLCYMSPDTETAEWASRLSGVIQKTVTRYEKVKVKQGVAELWDNERGLGTSEENLVHQNVFRMLPERTGVLFVPNQLARLLYTCWVPVDISIPVPYFTAEDVAASSEGTPCVPDEPREVPATSMIDEEDIFKIR